VSRLDRVDLTDPVAIAAAAIADAEEAMAGGRLVDEGPEVGGPRLPLELCNFSTPECPHYACPDGWHAGAAPNCSCTPDCALEDDDDDDPE
jgi:hypothetical protein